MIINDSIVAIFLKVPKIVDPKYSHYKKQNSSHVR